MCLVTAKRYKYLLRIMRITIAVLNDNDDEQLFDYPGQLGQ